VHRTTRIRRFALAVSAAAAMAIPVQAADAPPYWAYPVNPPGLKPAPDDGTPRTVPGSTVSMTLTQIRDLFIAPVWHPGDHAAMPDSVAFGRKPRLFACGYCHMPHGLGRPENSSLAGLPVEYIVQQVADFKSGARRSSEPNSLPVNFMIVAAKAATDAEVREAAEYFASLPRLPWIRVIEADEVPKTHVTGWMLAANEPREMEPIGARIIEIPEDLERTELRDTRSPFIAYVPTGSIARGKELVATGAGRTTPCGTCHGDDLRGLGPIPGLAGRSPSYLIRQLYDMQHGMRNGPWMDLMRPVVKNLTLDDMIAIAAYSASREP
jgi:cytochrome c553